MRIVLLHSGIRGPATYCLNLYKYLREKGHQVLLISEAKWEKEKVAMYQASSIKLMGLVPVVYKPWGIIKAIEGFKPDLIHYHWPCGTMDLLFKHIRRFQVPIIITIHVSVASKKFIFDKLYYAHFSVFKKNLKKVEAVIDISEFIKKQVKSRIKLPESKHVLLYAGVNHKVFKPVKRKPSNEFNILFIGQIMPEKGVDILIDVVKRINKERKIKLNIVGRGHLAKMLQEKTKDDSYINWVGFLPRQKDIASQYAQADITALPTRWDEPFSLVPVESMACGTPVLASDCGGNPEIVKPNKTGYLIEPYNKEQLYKVLLNVNRDKLSAMRKNCRESVLKKYTLDLFGKNHEVLYKKLIGEYSPN